MNPDGAGAGVVAVAAGASLLPLVRGGAGGGAD